MNGSLKTSIGGDTDRVIQSALGEAQRRFDGIADRLRLDSATHELLRSPLAEHSVLLPVRLDDGTTRVFRGGRVQHNNALVPAALKNQITGANASRVHGRVRVIVEAANAPMSAEANQILEDRGVHVIPDILANAGGVTCSYFEQVQGHSNDSWDRDEVLQRLDSWMTAAFHAVHEKATTEQLSLRDSAYVIAVDCVARACRERGWV